MAGSITKPKKPKSKRTPVRLRHKIEKASAAKQKKERKLAKKNPEWRSKLKKDPGIPNLFPYKEKLLQEIEENRLKKAEEAQRRKELAKAAKTGSKDEATTTDVQVDVGDEMDEDGMDEDIDESNPMAALIASARAAAATYDRQLADDDDMDEDD
ncbi:nuclear GTP-binding NUG1, partial [Fusarium denticulatum]